MLTKILAPLACLGLVIGLSLAATESKPPHILFFSKSSGFEHSVISWKNGQPSHAEKVLLELGAKQGWDFEFSKDGSKFSKEYLAQFDAVFFYTTGNLLEEGTDKNPPMSAEGKQALFDFIKSGKGFIGTHSASDTFHTDNEAVKGPERYLNHGEKADPYVRMLGAEFIIHGAQQVAKNNVINPAFPGFESVGTDFAFQEEWYSLKDFRDDLHVITAIDAPAMEGSMYGRPAYPTTWARKEGDGRVWYTAMGHREDVWTNQIFQRILVGGINWALGRVEAAVPPNMSQATPEAGTNPPYVPQKLKAPAKPKAVAEPKAP